MSAPLPPLTHGRIWRIAGPIVLSNATVPLIGLVDTGVIGRMGGAAPIAAVGLGAVILASIYWIFGFLRMGTSGLAAQAHGAGDGAESSAVLLRALIVAVAAGLGLVLLQGPVFAGVMWLSPATEGVEGLAREYLAIRIWGAPSTIAIFAVMGWLLATERARGMLGVQLWITGVNLVLNLWFVLGLGWGVPGVAVASLMAEWSGLALGLWLCRSAFGAGFAAARARIRDAAALRVMVAVNGDIMVRSVLLQMCFTVFVFMGARHGDVQQAANHILLQFFEITAYALDGFAFAAETLVGQAVGARAVAGVRQATRLAMIWGLIGAGLLALIFALFGGMVIDLLTTAPEVRAEARLFLWGVVAAPVLGTVAWTFDGVYIGATMTRAMRQVMVQCVAIYAVALVVLVPMFDNHGLWAALMVLMVVRSVLMTRRYPQVLAKAGRA